MRASVYKRMLSAAEFCVCLHEQVRYRYPHRLIFLAGLPKSGTEWLHKMLLEIPGYRRAKVDDPCQRLKNHQIDKTILEQAVRGLGFRVLKTHARATQEALDGLKSLGIKTIVMWRDPRDQAISRYYDVLSRPKHRHFRLYEGLSRKDGVSHSVRVTIEEYVPWIEEWYQALQADRDGFMLVRYEDLVCDARPTFCHVLDFYRIALSEGWINRIIDAGSVSNKAGGDLRERLTRGNTFRAGRTGEWLTHFSEHDARRFLENAGCLLVRLGYEVDYDWMKRVTRRVSP